MLIDGQWATFTKITDIYQVRKIRPTYRGYSSVSRNCSQYCANKPEVRNRRWRPSNRKYSYFSFPTRWQRYSTGHLRFRGSNTMESVEILCDQFRSRKTPSGGLQTGSTYIWACRFFLNELSTTIYVFEVYSDQWDNKDWFRYLTGSEKSNLVAPKSGSTYISACR